MKKTLFHFGFKIILLCVFLTHAVYAANSFVVKSIQVQGLQRIRVDTVLGYVPLSRGQTFHSSDSGKIIRGLYRSGFFDDIQLRQQGNALIIKVVERPTIDSISINGNRAITKEILQGVLKDAGLAKGKIFDRSLLVRFEKELQKQYLSMGKQNASVDSQVTRLPRNRVAVKITVTEGKATKIKKIAFEGNHAFSDKELSKQINIQSSGLLTWFTKKNHYSKSKLDDALRALETFYINHGYIRARITKPIVIISPDHKTVDITIRIDEGQLYHFSGIDLTGRFIIPKSELLKRINIHKGDVFSRLAVNHAISVVGESYGNIGYGFPHINAQPNVDESKHTIFVTIDIDPGVKVYVRRISFTGNTKTADYVLRHAMLQNEAELLKLSNVKESERQLRITQYFKDVSVKTTPVPGTNNQIDLDYHVTETPSAQATASLGYGTLGLEFNAGFNQPNFLGTGRTVGINFMARTDLRDLNFNYFNPYYSDSIGMGVSTFYTKYKPGQQGVASYTTDRFGGNVYYNMRMDQYNSVTYGYGFEHLRLSINPTIPEYAAFVYGPMLANGYGKLFNQGNIQAGWNYNSYDKFPFPTRGYRHQASAQLKFPLSDSSLTYYKLVYTGHFYYPLFKGFIFSGRGSVSYGNGFGNTKALPFYENFYAGGIGGSGQVRGYGPFSLGPKDTRSTVITNSPIGGNALVTGSAELILPYPKNSHTFRTSVFVDAGNVYSYDTPGYLTGTSAGPIRFSAGVGLEWVSPFGPMQFSIAKALNPQPGDDLNFFQFTLSTGF